MNGKRSCHGCSCGSHPHGLLDMVGHALANVLRTLSAHTLPDDRTLRITFTFGYVSISSSNIRQAGKSVVALYPPFAITPIACSLFDAVSTSLSSSSRTERAYSAHTGACPDKASSSIWYVLYPNLRSAMARLDVPVRPNPAPRTLSGSVDDADCSSSFAVKIRERLFASSTTSWSDTDASPSLLLLVAGAMLVLSRGMDLANSSKCTSKYKK
mmetsp:Transcript_3720/g.8373  ORF Transcript_3720/g.8373 Transcript_3720/m.8373 type:complete len:213 (-) Transcript_3720:134-772(-)